MEVAGVVLGALPLALSAIDNYHKCLQLTTDYLRFESTIKLIRGHIFVQQEQLHITLRGIGLVNPTPPELEEHLRQLYPDKYETVLDIIKHMESILTKLMDKLDIDSRGKPRWTTEPPDRASWEWRRVKRSFGRSSRQKLVEELQFWNDALKLCFEKSEIPLDSDTPNLRLATIKGSFSAQSCAATREKASRIHDAVLRSWRCQSHSHRGNLELSWHTEERSKPGGFNVLLSYLESSTDVPCELWQRLCLEVEDPYSQALELPAVATPAPIQSLAPDSSIRPRKRFKTWIYGQDIQATAEQARSQSSQHGSGSQQADDIEMSGGTSRTPSPSISPRLLDSPPTIDCLCSFLHDSRRLGRLKIDGHNGRSRMCVRLERQKNLDRQVKTVPLSVILTPRQGLSNPKSTDPALSRKDRFAMAAAATWAVLYLGDSQWISDDWVVKDRLHVVFENHVMVSRWYPSIPFALGRVADVPPSAAGFVPEGLRSSLVRNKTIFALGILLIELSLNKSFEQLRQECRDDNMAAPLGVGPMPDDYEVANLLMQKVYLEAGDFYGYAVQRCLRCEFPGRDITKNFSFEQFRRDFFSYVVAPVQATFSLLPSSQFSL